MEKYLPVGSVVLLNNGVKPVVIIGYKVSAVDGKSYKNSKEVSNSHVFDYCAVTYPEGLISSDVLCMFDHGDIFKLLYMGYVTDEMNVINQKLKEMGD